MALGKTAWRRGLQAILENASLYFKLNSGVKGNIGPKALPDVKGEEVQIPLVS